MDETIESMNEWSKMNDISIYERLWWMDEWSKMNDISIAWLYVVVNGLWMVRLYGKANEISRNGGVNRKCMCTWWI